MPACRYCNDTGMQTLLYSRVLCTECKAGEVRPGNYALDPEFVEAEDAWIIGGVQFPVSELWELETCTREHFEGVVRVWRETGALTEPEIQAVTRLTRRTG